MMKEERKQMMGHHGPSLPYPLVLGKQGQVEDLELNSPEANGNSPIPRVEWQPFPPQPFPAKQRQSKCGLCKAQPCRGYFPKIQLLKPAEWTIAAWRFSPGTGPELDRTANWACPVLKMAFLSCLCPTKHSINSDPESKVSYTWKEATCQSYPWCGSAEWTHLSVSENGLVTHSSLRIHMCHRRNIVFGVLSSHH